MRRGSPLLEETMGRILGFYRSGVGKKWVMALTGVVLFG